MNALPPAVELSDITKSFGRLVANDAVNLRVAQGSIHALVGENGAGKTTLMKILFGLKEGGVDYVYDDKNKSLIPDAVHAKVEALRSQIVSGAIQVPSE